MTYVPDHFYYPESSRGFGCRTHALDVARCSFEGLDGLYLQWFHGTASDDTRAFFRELDVGGRLAQRAVRGSQHRRTVWELLPRLLDEALPSSPVVPRSPFGI